MRLTRAAQRAQQDDEPTIDTTEIKDRAPLNEISTNASPEQVAPDETAAKKTPARTKSKKGGKKGAKGKKTKSVEVEDEQAPAVPEDEPEATPTPTEVEAEENVAQEATEDASSVPATDGSPASPQPKVARLTRRQLAKQEEELRESQRTQSPPRQSESTSVTEGVAQPTSDQAQGETIAERDVEGTEVVIAKDTPLKVAEDTVSEVTTTPEATVQQDPDVDNATTEETNAGAQETQPATADVVQEASDSVGAMDLEAEAIAPSVQVTSEPEPKTLAAERPSDAASTPALSRTPSRRTSRSPSKSPMRIEESIEALDALEEALEDVGKAVSHFDNSREERSPRKKAAVKAPSTPNARTKTPRKTPVATRISKAPSAAPKSIKPPTSSLARASSVRAPPAKEARKGSTDTVDYLASKRRPVSVNFPTPPPPPKGRAPTKATFQLSSDAVATKLKAQKEERQKREAEREAEGLPVKQRPISMPPVAKSTKAPTKATFVLPGEAIAAKLKAQKEERQKREAESAQTDQPKARPVSISMPPPTVKSSKPPTKATFVLPGEAVAAKLKAQREERQKREEEAEAAKKAAAAAKPRGAVRKSVALPTRAQPGVSTPLPSKTETPAPTAMRSTSLASKRTSMQPMRTISGSTDASKRESIIVAKASVTPVDAVQQKMKGREVFNRDKMEKESKEKEKKDKEDAAKQARAQAAERGRIASREWAEKQRRKMAERAEAA